MRGCAAGGGAADGVPHAVLRPSSSLGSGRSTPHRRMRCSAIAASTSQSQPQAREWHRPAHALVALARVAPDRATPFMARAAAHEIWQVRMYAARAAGLLKDRVTLDALAADADDNVRHAAVETLQPLVGHEADQQYLASLDRGDYQLLRAAARALAGTTRKPEASAALLKAFVRISKDRRDTSRDARIALLETLEETGKAATGRLRAPARARPQAPQARRQPQPRARERARARQPMLTSPRCGRISRTSIRSWRRRVAMLLTAWTGHGHTATTGPGADGPDRGRRRRRERAHWRPGGGGGGSAVTSRDRAARADAGDRADGAGRDVHAGVAAGGGADECGAVRQAGAGGVFQRADAASRRAEFRRAGRQSRRERIRGRRGLHARRSSTSPRTNAAPSASRPAAATPATGRSTSTSSTTPASITTTPSSPKSSKACPSSTPSSKATSSPASSCASGRSSLRSAHECSRTASSSRRRRSRRLRRPGGGRGVRSCRANARRRCRRRGRA